MPRARKVSYSVQTQFQVSFKNGNWVEGIFTHLLGCRQTGFLEIKFRYLERANFIFINFSIFFFIWSLERKLKTSTHIKATILYFLNLKKTKVHCCHFTTFVDGKDKQVWVYFLYKRGFLFNADESKWWTRRQRLLLTFT